MVWLYVPGLEVSNSASISPSLISDVSVTSKGRPIRPRYLSRAWKKEYWIHRLSGIRLKRSMAARGVGRWISSLPDSPASPYRPQASASGPRIRDGYGATSPGSSARWDPGRSSWRTFQASFTGGWVMFSGPWPTSGIMLDGAFSPRPPLAPLTSGNGSLSWPTPTSSMLYVGDQERARYEGRTLPTPTVADSRRTSDKYPRGNLTLRGALQMLPTPLARDSRSYKGAARGKRSDGGEPLPIAVGGVLYPPFVEWMMGLPFGWTGLEHVGTGSFRSWLLLHITVFEELSNR